MVLEPFSAVSLAGNIAQFIGLSCTLLLETKEIYNSGSDLQADAENLRSLTSDLDHLCKNLRTPDDQQPIEGESQPKDKQDLNDRVARENESAALTELAKECEASAKELLAALSKLAINGKRSKWSSFRAALSTQWNKGKLDSMSKKLDSYRMQLILRLQHMER
jgi:hypothetical protein